MPNFIQFVRSRVARIRSNERLNDWKLGDTGHFPQAEYQKEPFSAVIPQFWLLALSFGLATIRDLKFTKHQ
jgi:hypothetical protein